MKAIFEITDKTIIYEILDQAEYGTLAVSAADVPYAVPLNFVRIGDALYFHGSLSNKKMKILSQNPKVSFSVVENYALISSYFSSTEGLACPATQFFRSVSIEGVSEIITTREEKAMVLEALMQKLQPQGGYKPFEDVVYDKAIKATAIVMIKIESMHAKCKLGQHLPHERFAMILSHLEKRDSERDHKTVEMMKIARRRDGI